MANIASFVRKTEFDKKHSHRPGNKIWNGQL